MAWLHAKSFIESHVLRDLLITLWDGLNNYYSFIAVSYWIFLLIDASALRILNLITIQRNEANKIIHNKYHQYVIHNPLSNKA